jgi:murein L,D-transpeptidase YafK
MRISGLMVAGAIFAHLLAASEGAAKRAEPATASASSAGLVSEAAREALEARRSATQPEQTSTGIVIEPKQAGEKAAQTPLPASALTTDRDARLAAKGLSAGNPVMIRIFKAESEFELWMQKDERFELFATYPICKWSGKLGPKLHEGDKQAPEGVYTVAMPQIHRRGRWPRSLNIGYPNAFDKALERTGSLILVHGGCSSTGCYAMTNPQMEEIYRLSERALQQGQQFIPVHVFPFRMTDTNLAAHADSEWQPFWRNIKDAYDVFERTRVPPSVKVCGKKYVVREGIAPGGIQTASASLDTGAGADCVDTAPDPSQQTMLPDDDAEPAQVTRSRKVVSKTQRRRSAGRNTRKAYAEARKSRMAAHAARTKQASATKAAR